MNEPAQFRDAVTVTLEEASQVIASLAEQQSVLLLSQPGLGKSDIVARAAARAGLPLRSLLGTQIAPEDVSGIPRIEGNRSVFCPPRILLPEDDAPFCLFLDELPATSPEVQKAFYSILLERRIGEFPLPPGTWVVAAGNRVEDQSLVRVMSAALVNRVTILQVRADRKEWFQWAADKGIRSDILAFLAMTPEALVRQPPRLPEPFSTPRSWARLSESLDRMEQAGLAAPDLVRALAFGTVSPEDAAVFAEVSNHGIEARPVTDYVFGGAPMPDERTAVWLIVRLLRDLVGSRAGEGYREFEAALSQEGGTDQLNAFLLGLDGELRSAILVDLVDRWCELGADAAIVYTLRELLGLER